MSHPSTAEEHLRIIRSLMEKATIYRAISAQAALLGGLLAAVAGGLLAGRHDVFVKALATTRNFATDAEVAGFQLKWLVVFLLSVAANVVFLQRDARRRHEPFVSPGMRLALRAMLPGLLCGAVVASLGPRVVLPQLWMVFYGLSLLSTAHFAPASLVRLGWAFLLTGCALLLVNGEILLGFREHVALPGPGEQKPAAAWTYTDALMACTFGAYHLIYAVCSARRGPAPLAA